MCLTYLIFDVSLASHLSSLFFFWLVVTAKAVSFQKKSSLYLMLRFRDISQENNLEEEQIYFLILWDAIKLTTPRGSYCTVTDHPKFLRRKITVSSVGLKRLFLNFLKPPAKTTILHLKDALRHAFNFVLSSPILCISISVPFFRTMMPLCWLVNDSSYYGLQEMTTATATTTPQINDVIGWLTKIIVLHVRHAFWCNLLTSSTKRRLEL